MKRREFMNWVGLGVLASSLPAAIAACRSSDTSVTFEGDSITSVEVDSSPRLDGFAAIGTIAELQKDSFISNRTFQGEQVIVIRDPADPTGILAINSLCTHQGCSVAWIDDDQAFSCPCHGSKFNPDGSVAAGPAESPLGMFEAKVEGDLVLVKAI